MLGRTVYAAPATRMAAGTARISIPVSEFANGMYNVKVQTENGTITEKFNVIK
jgi:leucyl aminopeptidase (aminopeptidase T)